MYLNWKDEYRTGISQIDDEHKRMFDTYNNLVKNLDEGMGSRDLNELMHFLTNYIKYHMKSEEELQRKIHYPFVEKHKELHKKFIEDIRVYFEKYLNKTLSTLDITSLTHFLEEWLIEHIIDEDIEIMKPIKQK